MRDTVKRLSGHDFEVLALRLILAYLADDPAETTALVGIMVNETGATRAQFELAEHTAREAAGWWKRANGGVGGAEKARTMLYRKLEALLSE
jgi:hypothetical protein